MRGQRNFQMETLKPIVALIFILIVNAAWASEPSSCNDLLVGQQVRTSRALGLLRKARAQNAEPSPEVPVKQEPASPEAVSSAPALPEHDTPEPAAPPEPAATKQASEPQATPEAAPVAPVQPVVKSGRPEQKGQVENLAAMLLGQTVEEKSWPQLIGIRKVGKFIEDVERLPLAVAVDFIASIKDWEVSEDINQKVFSNQLVEGSQTAASYWISSARFEGGLLFYDDHTEVIALGVLLNDAPVESPEYLDFVNSLGFYQGWASSELSNWNELVQEAFVKVSAFTSSFQNPSNAKKSAQAVLYMQTVGAVFPTLVSLGLVEPSEFIEGLRSLMIQPDLDFKLRERAYIEFIAANSDADFFHWYKSGSSDVRGFEIWTNETLDSLFTANEVREIESHAVDLHGVSSLRDRRILAAVGHLRAEKNRTDK